MKCKHCGAELQENEQFCYRCGQAAAPEKLYCSHCGAELEAGDGFCWKCGKTVEGAAAPAQGTSAEDRAKAELKARTKALVLAAQKGDEGSFSQLYELYYPKVFALAKTTVKTDADAEDVLQMTFFKAWSNLGKLKDPSAFSTWIQRITLNQCYSLLRKKRVDVSIDEDDEDAEPIQLESDLMLPEVYAERSDLKARLGKIIRELSDVQQQTITLYYYDGLPVENIAWIMDCGVNTVKSRLFLARKSIKTEIEEQERKSGQKFYGMVGLGTVPFGRLFLCHVEASALPKAAAAQVLKTITGQIAKAAARSAAAGGNAAAGAAQTAAKTAVGEAAKAGIGTTAKAAGTVAAKTGAATAAKTAAAVVSKKVMTGILAAVLATGAVTGGTVAAVNASRNRQNDEASFHTTATDDSRPAAKPKSQTAKSQTAKPDDDPPSEPAFTFPFQQEEEPKGPSKAEREAYGAYLELLQREKEGIDNYIWQRGYTLFYDDDYEIVPLTDANLSRPVALCNVYGDDVPELIYIGDVDQGRWEGDYYYNDSSANLHIVTYKDGQLVTLYTGAWDGWGDSFESYHLFRVNGDLYASTANGDLSSWEYVYRFIEGTDGKLRSRQVCLHYYDEEADSEAEKNTFYAEEGQKITQEEYNRVLRDLNDNTDTILMYSYLWVEPFRDAVAQHGCIAMTCDEAMAFLQELLDQGGVPEGQVSDARLFNAYAAYREYLIPRMTGIENYVWQRSDWENFYDVDEQTQRLILRKEPTTEDVRTIPRSVVFYDIYGDAVPELIYVGDVATPTISASSTLNVLTYKDGRIVSLYSGPWDTPEYEESVYAHSLLVRPDGTLIFYRGEGSTFDSLDYYEEFILGEDGKLNKRFALKHIYDEYEHAEGDGSPVVEKYIGPDQTSVTKAEYEALLEQKAPKNSILLFDRYGYADFAMTAQEAVDYLADQLTASLPTIAFPDDLPPEFFFGSGVGGWGDWVTIHRDGTITGRSYDWDGGNGGPGYDSTYEYYAAFSCRFRDLKQINAYTYILTVYDVVSQYEDGKEEIQDRVRYIYSGACPFRDGMRITVYAKGAPVGCIPAELREMYEMAAAARVNGTMPCWTVIYGSGDRGFFE